MLPPHPEKGLLRPLVVDEKGLEMPARPEGALWVGVAVGVWVGCLDPRIAHAIVKLPYPLL